MSLADMTSGRSSPNPEGCPECDTSASVTSDLHKYQVACTCKPASVQYACADEPGPPPPVKTDTPPALPPRPPANVLATNRRNNASVGCTTTDTGCRRRKYAWWCVGCGALAAALGGLLAAQHILLRTYTASPQHLETVPAAVPAAMLVLTGVCIMSLARRRNRYSYMIKVVGACCLVCALTCVLVTITTTVIHMNKLQTLKFCEFTKLTRTCTCFSMPPDLQHSGNDDDGVRCVFEGVSDCGVVHGALYWCLRGVFALSVTAVLLCIFSSMLAYQLLSHERKKMYWEQLELRCRSLYRPPANQNTANTGRPAQASCSCCPQCHPNEPTWDISLQHRFWAPGRIGNLYSPNPGTVRKTSAWSWFPWPRSNSQNSRSCRMGGVPQSGDGAYGFCDTDNPQPNQNPNPGQYEDRVYPVNFSPRTQTMPNFAIGNQFVQGQAQFVNQAQFGQQSGSFQDNSFGETSGSYDAQTGVWGPPPPYSPQGRSGSRHHLHQDPAAATLLHHHHIEVHRNSMPIHDHTNVSQPKTHACRNSYMGHLIHQNVHLAEISRINPELARINPDIARINPDIARLNPDLARLNPELARINPDLARINPDIARINPDLARIGQELVRLNYPAEEIARYQAEVARMGADSRFNTLRGHLVAYPGCQRSLGVSMGNIHRDCRLADETMTIECLHQKSNSRVSDQSSDSCVKQGKENLAFQKDQHAAARSSMQCHGGVPNAESEVYFADGSSCCNVSLKAECCQQVPALVGTIENHPESTSESENGSFTLTRQQRPQPQTSTSKRRPRTDKHIKNQEKLRQELNNSIRMAEQQIEQLNHSMTQRLNEVRMSERLNERIMNERSSERLNDSLRSERLNESLRSERMNESIRGELMSETIRGERMNDSIRGERMNDSIRGERMNESLRSGLNESLRIERMDSRERMSERRSSDQSRSDFEKSPKAKPSPLRFKSPRQSPLHQKQSSSDSTASHPEFFVPPPPVISPLTPNTEESLLSEEDERSEPIAESSKGLNNSQFEKPKEDLKTSHHHCYSDTNTMDSGWQSGSEKQATD